MEEEMKGIIFNAPVSVGTFVKVESGSTYIKNNFPNVTKYNEREEDEKELNEAKMSNLEKALRVVAEMANEGYFKPQKNYIAPYRVIVENYSPSMETAEFCRLMESKTDLSKELLPKNDNIRRIYFEKDKYPNWQFLGEGAEWTQSVIDIATEMLKRIKK